MSTSLPELRRTPVLETDRLVLRCPIPSDFPSYRSYVTSDRTTYIGGPQPAAVAFERFAGFIGQWALRGYGRFTITRRSDGAPLGHVGPLHMDDEALPELTWTLWSKEAEGNGYAYEAAYAVNTWVFGTLGMRETVAEVHRDNRRSRDLAERLGGRLWPDGPGAKFEDGVVYQYMADCVADLEGAG
jgi:ribosomal-protein-alanine N-acetyltransferase